MIFDLTILLLIISIVRTSVISYNRPNLLSNATWNRSAITLADKNIVGNKPRGIYIDTENNFYFADYEKNRSIWWPLNRTTATYQSFFYRFLAEYTTILVSNDRYIYVENKTRPGYIIRQRTNDTSDQYVFQFTNSCVGLFIDLNNTLYCSIFSLNQVDTISLNGNGNSSMTRAGNGVAGNAMNQLCGPWGIFVDTNFDLYVADALNDRIQLFRSGQSNGTTIAGQGYPNNLFLKLPTDIILDGNNQMYIADNENHRIVRVISNNFECLLGCSGSSGMAADHLYKPYSLRFDTNGNLYVADEFNDRIQKLILQQASSLSTAQTLSMVLNHTIQKASPCDILEPCLNNGFCSDTNITTFGYQCVCLTGFHGQDCQFDDRVCQKSTCRNNGTCIVLANQTYLCQCSSDWEGTRCERRQNLCKNITCENGGVCRSLIKSYQCECLKGSYTGPLCEIVLSRAMLFEYCARSIGYTMIIFLCSVALFIITLDLLKYVFGIDLVKYQSLPMAKRKKRRIIIHYFYVNNAPSCE